MTEQEFFTQAITNEFVFGDTLSSGELVVLLTKNGYIEKYDKFSIGQRITFHRVLKPFTMLNSDGSKYSCVPNEKIHIGYGKGAFTVGFDYVLNYNYEK